MVDTKLSLLHFPLLNGQVNDDERPVSALCHLGQHNVDKVHALLLDKIVLAFKVNKGHKHIRSQLVDVVHHGHIKLLNVLEALAPHPGVEIVISA